MTGPASPAVTADLPRNLAERGLTIAVLGDAILDGWLTGSSHRLCPEAPVPVVQVDFTEHTAGGAANTALNLAALGATVRLVSVVGADLAGETLLGILRGHGVDTGSVVVDPERTTIAKRRVVVADQIMLRVDEGHRCPLGTTVRERLVDAALAAVADADAVLVCDYDTGVLDPVLAQRLAEVRDTFPLLVVDAHDIGRWRELRPDVVTPNAAEAAAVLGVSLFGGGDRLAQLEPRRAALHTATGATTVALTLDREGAVVYSTGQPAHRTWARPAPDNHAAGAGDSFAAALTLGLAGGLPVSVAAELAQCAADVVTARPGTVTCGTADLIGRLQAHHGSTVSAERLLHLVAEHRRAGRRIVFTNGCFDVLHRGHVAYLNEARRLGDVLVVAVNSDDSVRRLKGPQRPVNPAADRAAVLAALSCVDHVAVFGEDTPIHLLERVRPEVYVKGGDYTPQMLPEADTVLGYGGSVRILDYVDGQSTTAIIERIRR